MSAKPDRKWLDPMDIGIAIAMRNTGFSRDDIVSVLGYMPKLDITPEELEASVAAEIAFETDDE
jgi:hypothetical protein